MAVKNSIIVIYAIALTAAAHAGAFDHPVFISEAWTMATSDQPPANTCIDIPKKFALCYGMQYNSMRIPNLLEHENLDEIIEQSSAWQSLVRVHCSPNTQLFLCSLFAPVCLPNLDKPIKPCKSLCLEVQHSCENRMKQYGFPWPEMLSCEQFEDDDMCIKPVTVSKITENNSVCKSCHQAATFENILDNFCRASIVLRARIQPVNETHLVVKKAKVFKDSPLAHHRPASNLYVRLAAVSDSPSCRCSITKGTFLIMANADSNGDLAAKLILPWHQEKHFKAIIRRFKSVDCTTLGREIRESVMRQTYKRTTHY